MIFKCKNCGKEYEYQVAYCDCGNNTFVVLNAELKNDVQEELNNIYLKYDKSNDDFLNTDNQLNNPISDKQKNRLAIIVLILSIIFAGFIMFFAIPSIMKKDKTVLEPVEIEQYIPTKIDEYWINSNPPSSIPSQTKKQNNIKVQNAISQPDTNSVQPKENKTTPLHIKTVSIPNKQQKTANKSTDSISLKNQRIEQKNIIKENSTTTQKAKEDTNSINELNSYKVSLRKKLFSCFPILTVQGQGIAKIAFSISNDGKLLNRHFITQSGNKSLDDAMYHMLMRVPQYSQPPSSYNGQELILQMEFNNGSYSFSYLN
jgi:hypothetical protein